MKTFDFTLQTPIEYHDKGEKKESTLLTLSAPNVKARKNAARLKQGIMRAINGIEVKGEIDQKKSKEDIKPNEVLALIQMSNVEYDEYIDTFIKLLGCGICKIEDSIVMTNTIAESIEDFEDIERLMGEYLVNFLIGSLVS